MGREDVFAAESHLPLPVRAAVRRARPRHAPSALGSGVNTTQIPAGVCIYMYFFFFWRLLESRYFFKINYVKGASEFMNRDEGGGGGRF